MGNADCIIESRSFAMRNYDCDKLQRMSNQVAVSDYRHHSSSTSTSARGIWHLTMAACCCPSPLNLRSK